MQDRVNDEVLATMRERDFFRQFVPPNPLPDGDLIARDDGPAAVVLDEHHDAVASVPLAELIRAMHPARPPGTMAP